MMQLAPRDAYRLWAPSYEAGNPVTHLDQRLVAELGPSPEGLRLLDAGCGTGWRLAGSGAAHAVGVDLSPDMLAIGRANPALAGVELIEGDLRALPLPDGGFDLVWCRLAIGYVAELELAYTELARVAAIGASVVVSDFHPDASSAGLRRTLSHEGETYEVTNFAHAAEQHLAAAAQAGLVLQRQAEAAVGPEVRPYFVEAGKPALYDQLTGQPLVLAFRFAREGPDEPNAHAGKLSRNEPDS